MISKSSNIARRAKRVVDVAEAEMENSLDPDYVAKMAAAKDNLGQCKCFIHNTAQKTSLSVCSGNLWLLPGRLRQL